MVRGLGLRKKPAEPSETEMSSDIKSIKDRQAVLRAAAAGASPYGHEEGDDNDGDDDDGTTTTTTSTGSDGSSIATGSAVDAAFATLELSPSPHSREIGDSPAIDDTDNANDTTNNSNPLGSSGRRTNDSSNSPEIQLPLSPYHVIEGDDEHSEILITPIAIPPKTAVQLRYDAPPVCERDL